MKNGVREFNCTGCGKLVIKSCTKSVRFCSPECYHAHKPPNSIKRGEEKTCVNCGKVFYVPAHRAIKAIACSTECANAYQGRNKVRLVCDVCHKEFVRSPFFKEQKFCSIKCRNESEGFKEHLVQMNAKQSKMFPNRFEVAAYGLLEQLGLDFIPQYIVGGRFTVDAFVPSKNVVIQFDGDYWHGNPRLYPDPDPRQRKRMGFDASQDAYMRKVGIRVIRIWQSDFANIESVTALLSNI